MAAFVCEDPKDKVAFDAHWNKILNSSQNTTRTIVTEGQVAGHIACYPHRENIEVTYWLGREFWDRQSRSPKGSRKTHGMSFIFPLDALSRRRCKQPRKQTGS